MHRPRGASNERVIRKPGWSGTASTVGLLLTCLLLASCGSASDPSADAPSGSQPAQAIENDVSDPGACLPTSTFPVQAGKANVGLTREQLDANAAVSEGNCTYSLHDEDTVTILLTEFAGTVTVATMSKIDHDIVRFGLEITEESEMVCGIGGDTMGSAVSIDLGESHSVALEKGQSITVRSDADLCQFGIGFEPDTNCGATPTSLSGAMAFDIDRADCFYTAPVTLNAQVPGKINFFISPHPIKCAVDVLNTDGSTNFSFSLDSSKTVDESQMWSSGVTTKSVFGFIIGPNAGPDDNYGAWELGAGEGMTLSGKDGGTCRFQIFWTPSPTAVTTTTSTTTSTTAAPTTTSTTSTTSTTAAPATTSTPSTTTSTTAAPATTSTTSTTSTTTAAPVTTTTTGSGSSTGGASTTTSSTTSTTTSTPSTTSTTTVATTTTAAPTTTSTTTVATSTTAAPTTTAAAATTIAAPTTTVAATTTTTGNGSSVPIVALAGALVGGALVLLILWRRRRLTGTE